MASYKISDLPLSSAIACVTFSYWDNTAGPLTKCLWVHPSAATPEPTNIKLLTRLTLKTEVTRDPSLPDIDCNIYSLPELSYCAVGYLFGSTCKSKPGKTIYCVTFIYKLDHRSRYLQWRNIIDSVVKQDIRKYKLLLHKDFKKCNMAASNEHLHSTVKGAVELISRLEKNQLKPSFLKEVKNTYFNEVKEKRERLWQVLNCTLLSHGRMVVVGNSEKVKDKIDKWIRTLTLILPKEDRCCCFTCDLNYQTIIPNALVQGVISSEELMTNKGFLMTLYTACDYPMTVYDVNKHKLYRTAGYNFHQAHQDNIRATQLVDILTSPIPLSLPRALEEAKADMIVGADIPPVLAALRGNLYQLEVNGRLDYLEQYMAYMHSMASAIISYLTTSVSHEGVDKKTREEIAKYLQMNVDNVEVILCLAEYSLPGIYSSVADDSVDDKAKKVISLF